MKREEIKELLASISEKGEDSVIDGIMNINGDDINKAKADVSALRDTIAQRDKDIEALKAIPNNSEALQKQLDDLAAKYEKDTKELNAKIADRDYNDAVSAAIADNGIKFTSKFAENYFKTELKQKGLELKDGKLTGFDDFYKTQLEADATAFVTEASKDVKPKNFLGSAGANGGIPDNFAVQMAAKFNQKNGKGEK